MMRATLMAGTALLALVSPAMAQTTQPGPRVPPPCARDEDPRVRCIAAPRYGVVLLNAQRGATLLIEVPDGEKVVAVPASDQGKMQDPNAPVGRRMVVPVSDDGTAELQPSQAAQPATSDGNLQVKPRGTTVTVKPLTDLTEQPFFVVTEGPDGKQSRYRFQLQTVPLARDAYFSVTLRNVAAEQDARAVVWREARKARQEAFTNARLAQAQAAPCASRPGINPAYTARGAARLAPAEACDDGLNTYMRFVGTQRLPAVWMDGPDGKPALANPVTLKDGWVMVPGRSPRFTLRDGDGPDATLCVLNKRYTVQGQAIGTGTISPDVVREPRS
jgi:type IV secretory pathway VirB9-like protein